MRQGGGGEGYAIVHGPGLLLIVEDFTEAARRQWPTKKRRLSDSWESGILVEA